MLGKHSVRDTVPFVSKRGGGRRTTAPMTNATDTHFTSGCGLSSGMLGAGRARRQRQVTGSRVADRVR
jgi:hypothetical protein